MLKVTPLTTPVSVVGGNHFWAFGLDWVGPMKIGFHFKVNDKKR